MQLLHGSGKTAVLVERIIQKIINDNIDIDKLLVVTFTNAAAAEMRERVLDAIYKKLDEEPENSNLQRQIVLLGKASICTIHSFCLDVIKNNFFEIDLSANFRIAAEEENEILKQEVLEDVFEELYESEDEDFAKLVNTYTGYRGDEPLKDIILKIYRFMGSSPFPVEWLEEKVKMFKNTNSANSSMSSNTKDFSDSVWGKILLKNLQDEIYDSVSSLKIIRNKLEKYFELENYKLTIESDIQILKELYESTKESWDKSFEYSGNMKFRTWPQDRKLISGVKDEAKYSRDNIKNKIMKTIKNVLVYDSKSAYEDIFEMYDVLNILKEVIIKFDTMYKEKKKERNIIDFNDIEHYALKILVKKDENGNYVPTDVAKRYREKFEEIAIDEYQDSNEVQEYILNTVSRGNNLFMVGDVKQSIYKFRQACPELFLEKYYKFSLDGNENGLKIKLFKNFRSKKNVLDLTNIVFDSIMSKKLGDIDYNEEEYLNLGADFEKQENSLDIAEFDIIDLKEDEAVPDVWKSSEEDDDEIYEITEKLEKEEIEAKFVSKRIEEIISSKALVKDKKLGIRPVTYKDIVILLRSTSNTANIYEKELNKNNIPVFSDSSSEYLDSIEIQTIINLLKILDNPIDDISLVSVMRSEIGTFSDNEILEVRLINRNVSFYESLITSAENLENQELKEKVNSFLSNINTWRKESEYLTLAELIWRIYIDTGYYNYVGLMPNGTLRQANLKMLFERAKDYERTSFKGLFNFIKFIERLKNGNGDMASAKIIGENEDVVRIMSIHKSKGLEFPIVFLSGTSKRINMQDLNNELLLHQKLGIGPEYINYNKKIEYSTSAKDAIKTVIRDETISEEMRILYVALTRAKEKLVITGVSKDLNKDIDTKKELLKIYNENDGKINPILLKKYISYLDWLLLVYLKNDIKDIINLNIYKKNDVIKKCEEKEESLRKFDFNKEIDLSYLTKEFTWKYENEISTKLPIKSTVSKVKEIKNQDLNEGVDFDEINNKKIGLTDLVPSFIRGKEEVTGARKGTITHLVLENIDINLEYSETDIENLIDSLILKKLLLPEEKKLVNINSIKSFLKSSLAGNLRKCVKIEKEKEFCIKIKAKEIYEDATDEDILVQGIIDLFGITEDNKIVLVDYKTDFTKDEDVLIKRYCSQKSFRCLYLFFIFK